jgi:Transposase DDE domain
VKRRWLKLHLGVDATTDEIAAHVLTDGNADEAAQAPALLDPVTGALASFTGDGGYD